MRVSLIIPAHNEAQRITPTLHEYAEHLRGRYGADFEIIVVANGCTDTTVDVALAAAAVIPQIQVVDIQQPIGKGGAIMEGFRYARGQRIAFADADGATAPATLLTLIEGLDYSDVVIGSRRLPESVVTTKQPWQRRALSGLFALVVSVLFGLRYRDTQCGAKAFRRAAALQLAQVVGERRWVFDIDLLLSAQALNLSVAECPVVWTDKAGSRLRLRATAYEVAGSLWSLWCRQQQAWHMARMPRQRTTAEGGVPALRILALNWRCLQHPQCGGSEINLFEQARVWAREGHGVTVVCADPGRQYALERDDVVDGINVRRMGGRLTVYLHAALFLLRHSRDYDCVLDVANGIPFFAPLLCAWVEDAYRATARRLGPVGRTMR